MKILRLRIFTENLGCFQQLFTPNHVSSKYSPHCMPLESRFVGKYYFLWSDWKLSLCDLHIASGDSYSLSNMVLVP